MLSVCRHDTLTAHRARLTEPFKAAVVEVMGEMEGGNWDQGPAMSAAFSLDQEWLDGTGVGAGGTEQAGAEWKRRRKLVQRLGDCCLRLCAEMWCMAWFLWTASDRDRPEPTKDRSKRGRAWARKAEELLAANPGQMAKDISIYKMEGCSKRQSVYARGARATLTVCQ